MAIYDEKCYINVRIRCQWYLPNLQNRQVTSSGTQPFCWTKFVQPTQLNNMSKVKSLLYSPQAHLVNQLCSHRQPQNQTKLNNEQVMTVSGQPFSSDPSNEKVHVLTSSRPVSFTADSFENYNSPTTKRESLNAEDDLVTGNNKLHFRKVFVSFAVDLQAEQEQQLPYFCSLQQSSATKQCNSPCEDQNKVNNDSYKSKFILDTEDYCSIEWSQSIPFKQHQIALPPTSQKNRMKATLHQNNDIEHNIEQKTASVPKGKTMQSEGLLQIEKNKYKKISFRVSEAAVTIEEVPIQIKNISKIKMYPIDDQLPKCNTLKLTIKGMGEELLLGLKRRTLHGEFPLPYYTFVKIVIKKLKYIGISSVTEWQPPQKSPNAFYFKKIVRAEQKSNEHVKNERSLSRDDSHRKNVSKEKRKRTRSNVGSSTAEPKLIKANTFIHGKIYKKSKHWGYWEKRYAVINELGIYSYREQEDETASIKIERQHIRYIWTWFSVLVEHKKSVKRSWKVDSRQQFQTVQYEERQIRSKLTEDTGNSSSNYLIIKVKHGFSQHTEFAIPICNFDTDSKLKNWLYAFYRVLPFKQDKK